MNGDNKYKLYTPNGVQDFTLEQCYTKRDIEHKLRKQLRLRGFCEIETPSIEYYDVFAASETIEQEMMYKFVDHKGRLLVLRPDMTVPAARFYATKLEGASAPSKLFYIGNVYRYNVSGGGRTSEFTQAGIEIMGVSGTRADSEAIETAARLVLNSGLSEFQIDVGHVDFFKGLIEEAGFDEEEGEAVRLLVDKKNYAELELLLKDKSISDDVRAVLFELPTLFGGRDVLDRAASLIHNERSSKAIESLRSVLNALDDCGISEYITIDLGLVNSLNYYTGIVFKGFASGIGFPLLGGGRYDSLTAKYGAQAPAVGFCLGVNLLMQAMRRHDISLQETACDVYIGYDDDKRADMFKLCDFLRESSLSVCADISSLGEEASSEQSRELSCRTFIFLRADGTVRYIDNITGDSDIMNITNAENVRTLAADVIAKRRGICQ